MTKTQGLVQVLAPGGASLISIGAVLGAASTQDHWAPVILLGAGVLALVGFARYRVPNQVTSLLTPFRLYMLTIGVIFAALLLGIIIVPEAVPFAALAAGIMLALDLVVGRVVRVTGVCRYIPYAAAFALATGAVIRRGDFALGLATVVQGLLIGVVVMAAATAIFRLISRAAVDV